MFAQSRTIQERLTRWNRVDIRGACIRRLRRGRIDRNRYGDYLFFASRLAPLKRTDLILRALAQREAAAVRMVIGGEGEELPRLRILARELGLDDACHVYRPVSTNPELVDHLARCRAVVFVPKSEDYGFVTVEAFASGRPVITATDSGGPAELVSDGETAWSRRPNRARSRARSRR